MTFPTTRLRRLRRDERLRGLVAETRLDPSRFIMPLFVRPGRGERREIGAMPGNFQLSVDELVKEAVGLRDAGVGGIILFGIPEKKDARGSEGYADDGIVPVAVRALRDAVPELLLITDVCLCEYTDHGHCGLIEADDVANDPTLELLARQALSHARAGADIVAPSDMMDGRVGAIRAALDGAGFPGMPILSYAAKYASAFYGPFREAAESAPKFGDRRSYQMDPRNHDEALREIALDVEEGADIIMVKPAMPYLDVLRAARETFGMPTAAYQVSGEFSMIVAAANNGWLDRQRAVLESLTAIQRAGADFILTYFAREAAGYLEAGA
ncbi:MAG: porphobilinogen synthase [Acidobacteriota bacterium]